MRGDRCAAGVPLAGGTQARPCATSFHHQEVTVPSGFFLWGARAEGKNSTEKGGTSIGETGARAAASSPFRDLGSRPRMGWQSGRGVLRPQVAGRTRRAAPALPGEGAGESLGNNEAFPGPHTTSMGQNPGGGRQPSWVNCIDRDCSELAPAPTPTPGKHRTSPKLLKNLEGHTK